MQCPAGENVSQVAAKFGRGVDIAPRVNIIGCGCLSRSVDGLRSQCAPLKHSRRTVRNHRAITDT